MKMQHRLRSGRLARPFAGCVRARTLRVVRPLGVVPHQRQQPVDPVHHLAVGQGDKQRLDEAEMGRQQAAHRRGVAPEEQRRPGQRRQVQGRQQAEVHAPTPGRLRGAVGALSEQTGLNRLWADRSVPR